MRNTGKPIGNAAEDVPEAAARRFLERPQKDTRKKIPLSRRRQAAPSIIAPFYVALFFFMMTFILFLAMISFSLAIIFPAITRRVETNRTTTTDRPLFSPEMANEDESLGPQKKKQKKETK